MTDLDTRPSELPELETVTVKGVQIVKTGTYNARTGPVQIKPDDLQAMVDAAGDPEVRDGIIKLGHADTRFSDGGPAFGWVRNLRVKPISDTEAKLLGDYVGIPRKLASLILSKEDAPAPYRSRSAEIDWNVKTPSGKTHHAVLSAVAFLGEQPPAIADLDDIVNLYTAASGVATAESHTSLSLAPAPEQMTIRDSTIMNNGGTTNPGISFTTNTGYGFSTGTTGTTTANPVLFSQPEEGKLVAEAQEGKFYLDPTLLGLDESASEDEILARFDEVIGLAKKGMEFEDREKELAEREAALEKDDAPVPAGFIQLSQGQYDELKNAAEQGAEARQVQLSAERDSLIDWALSTGRITIGEKEFFRKLLDKDPVDTEKFLRQAKQGMKVPVTELGSSFVPEVEDDDDALYRKLFPDDKVEVN